jgi:hypothetical protein
MVKNIDAKISSLEIKSVALRKASAEIEEQLAAVKVLVLKPKPIAQVRQNKKQQRIISFASDYMKGKWKHKKSASA